MSLFTAASEVILRHQAQLIDRHVLFAGELADDLPAKLKTASSHAFTQHYHYWQRLTRHMGAAASYGFLADRERIHACDTLIYFWPKNKVEAQFHLAHLFSLLPIQTQVFIVGTNSSGVRSAPELLNSWLPLHKIDTARRSSLFAGELTQSLPFDVNEFKRHYQHEEITVCTLPGVFGSKGLDAGSALLLSTFTAPMQGSILDVGCGTGILAAMLAHRFPALQIALCDVHAAAVEASRDTFAINHLSGTIFSSNVFSDVNGRYNLIVSNPPFHEGVDTSQEAAKALIRAAPHHLQPGGELRVVGNAFLPYAQIFDETFGQHDVLAQNGRYKVYRAFHRG